MFIELVDLLRCPRPHELAWLVLASRRSANRDIMEGELGCSVCGARYPIVEGVADLRGDDPGAAAPPAGEPVTGELAVRAAALLGLAEAGGVAALAGTWSAAARGLAALVERVHVLAIDAGSEVPSGGGVSLARVGARLPLRPETVRGIALDTAHAGPVMLASAVDALQAGGRLVAPAGAALPAAVRELARDASHWVAVKPAAPGPVVQLRAAHGGAR